MKIRAIHTGTDRHQVTPVEGQGQGQRRLVNTFTDAEWTEPPPIHAFAIEHPGGVIVVEAGETARSRARGLPALASLLSLRTS
jgi:N-acyl homoserine lactone hydrolase